MTFSRGSLVAIYDEGYEGSRAIKNKFHRAVYSGISVDVSVTEYNKLLAMDITP